MELLCNFNVEVRTRTALNTDDTNVEIVEVHPERQSWSPDAHGNIRVSRFGFQLPPDLDGAIPILVSASLDAAMLDCLEISRTPTHADKLKGYLVNTSVRTKEGLRLMTSQLCHDTFFSKCEA